MCFCDNRMIQQQKKRQPQNLLLVSFIHLPRSETLLTRQPALLQGWLFYMWQLFKYLMVTGFYVYGITNSCQFTGTGLNLRQESVRMRSTIQSLTSSTRMTPTMPTIATKSMNLRRGKLKSHLQLCPKLCSRLCNSPSSFLRK